MMLTLAEAVGELVKNGGRLPARSIMIGHWDAEEQGVIGSTEWVEQYQEELEQKPVTYMNFDGWRIWKKLRSILCSYLEEFDYRSIQGSCYPDSAKTVFQVWAGKNDET